MLFHGLLSKPRLKSKINCYVRHLSLCYATSTKAQYSQVLNIQPISKAFSKMSLDCPPFVSSCSAPADGWVSTQNSLRTHSSSGISPKHPAARSTKNFSVFLFCVTAIGSTVLMLYIHHHLMIQF